MEAKGAFRVIGPWDGVLGSSGLPFDVNRMQSFLGVHGWWGLLVVYESRYIFFMCNLLRVVCAGKSRRRKLVNWVEKASFEKIRRLLEISEQERHHEVLLTLKNLGDVRRNSAPYSLPVIPRLLPSEIIVGEHFVATDLLQLLSGGKSPARGPEA